MTRGGMSIRFKPTTLKARSAIRLVRRSWHEIDSKAWDEEICDCGGSFLGAWAVLRVRRMLSPITFVEFELSSINGSPPIKIAQCAISKKRETIVLLERIYIRPGYDEYWSDCFSALVDEFPVNTFIYGSLWNCEPPRGFDVRDHIEQTPVEKVFRIHVIDTNRWNNFDEYLRKVSDSVRYDYKKAMGNGSLRTEVWRNWQAIRCVPKIIECRRSVTNKLGERFRDRKPEIVEAVRLVCKILLFGKRSIVALVMADDGCMAAFVGIEFGNRLYHLTGGTKQNRLGAGSLLILSIIKHLFTTDGKLVLGACWGEQEVEDYQTGALLYRRKLRVQALHGIYQKLVILPPSRKPLARKAYRYLRPWVPVAALALSGLL